MASSTFRDELEKDVEDFERRLRERRDRTKQSIDRLSVDCERNCSQVWKDFDALMEGARMKAGDLCKQLRRETSEQASEWRLSLEGMDKLLEEAAMWLIDLRHLLDAGNDDEGVVCGVESVRAKLSSRLHESLAPTEEGHFVVTFPQCCRRSLEELQAETVNFAVVTWPPTYLEQQDECLLQGPTLAIKSIAVSDEDGHFFVVDGPRQSIAEFDPSGQLVDRFHVGGGEPFHPWDICRLSGDTFVVCGSCSSLVSLAHGRLLFLSRQKSRPFLKIEKSIDAEKGKEFFSLCQMNGTIFLSDFHFKKIFCFPKEGNEIETIEIVDSPFSVHSYSLPVLRADPTTGNLWVTRRGMSEICVFQQNGEFLRSVKTEEEILDFRGDGFGRFYFCNLKGIFSLKPEKFLCKFPEESVYDPRIFVSPPKLFVSFQTYRGNLMKIFKINLKKNIFL